MCIRDSTERGVDCPFYGYCCGCCRLRHRGEYCVLDHGPHCQGLYCRSLNWGDGAALMEGHGASLDRHHDEAAPWELLDRLLGEAEPVHAPSLTQHRDGAAGNGSSGGEATACSTER